MRWNPVPQDYDDLLSYYTKRGYRVIAMAGKSIESLSWLKAQKLKRSVIMTAYHNSSSRVLPGSKQSQVYSS